MDVLVLVDAAARGDVASRAAAMLGPRIGRLAVAVVVGREGPASAPGTWATMRRVTSSVAVLRPASLLARGRFEDVAVALARTGAYDVAVVAEPDTNRAVTIARRAGIPVLVVRPAELPSVDRSLASRRS